MPAHARVCRQLWCECNVLLCTWMEYVSKCSGSYVHMVDEAVSKPEAHLKIALDFAHVCVCSPLLAVFEYIYIFCMYLYIYIYT